MGNRFCYDAYDFEKNKLGFSPEELETVPVKGLYDRMHHPDFPDDARHPVVLKRPSLCPPRNDKDRPGVPATMIQGNRKPYHAALSHTSPVSFRQKHDC